MKISSIVVGESYRMKDHPDYCYAEAVSILRPKEGINVHTYSIVKCKYSVEKNSKFSLIKYFKPGDLLEIRSSDKNTDSKE